MKTLQTRSSSSRRVTRTYRQTITASPEVVFPLLCPVREAEWLDGWRYTMIFSLSGLVEQGAVFTTPGDDEPATVWVVTKHDLQARRVEFTRFTPDSRVCVLQIGVTAHGHGNSFVDVSYTYTSIGHAGDRFLELFTEQAFLDAVTFWERSMNHWLETGERLARPA